MCKAFSCVVARTGKVYWKMGMDSHNDIIKEFKLEETNAKRGYCQIEVLPKDGYLNMKHPRFKSSWGLIFDDGTPDWWKASHETNVWGACSEWYDAINKIVKFKLVRNPINPLVGSPQIPTKTDIKNLREWASVLDSVGDGVWASVWNSVGDSVGDSVRDSVRASVTDSVWYSVRASVMDSVGDSVWYNVRASVLDSVGDGVWASVRDSGGDSVWAYTGSICTLPRNAWKYTDKIKCKRYPFASAVRLWKRGFVPSCDGKTWRLYSGAKAKVVYEWTPETKK